MSWNEQRSLDRIEKLVASAPAANIDVREFDFFLTERIALRDRILARGERFNEPIFAIPLNRAVLTHAVHVYANLTAFNERLTEDGRETEASHRRSMQFLHGHYEACDRLIASFGIQRVDFHGGRMHAVVLTPTGVENEVQRLENALAFAAALREMVGRMSNRYAGEFRTGVRIGIDSGPAVAVNSGRRGELEPLFIGSPANYAAKLASGSQEGIYLTDRAQRLLRAPPGLAMPSPFLLESARETVMLNRDIFANGRSASARARVDDAFAEFNAARGAIAEVLGVGRHAEFDFHYRQPPLRTIDYSEHPPSNSIRMAMASMFADIDGFTSYVDRAIAAGEIAQAVSNLHVLRGEMHYVARDDFHGRKVRYVGDCLHAILAEGDARNTDERATIREAVLAAAGIRSSFNLCRQMLPNIRQLGIAIGIELGPTPVARLGLMGDASVRCASSRATCVSEEVQSSCGGTETNIGKAAFAAAEPALKRLFAGGHAARNLDYSSALALISGASAAVAASVKSSAASPSVIRPQAQEMRAFGPGDPK